jgi:membrane protein
VWVQWTCHKWRDFCTIASNAVEEWRQDKAQRLGASVAFYALVSLAPLAVVIVAVATFFLGRKEAEGQLFLQTQNLLGTAGAETVIRIVDQSRQPSAGITATILGVLTLLWGSSSVIVELQDALDTIWHISSNRSRSMLSSLAALLRDRLYSVLIVFFGGIVLLGSAALSAILASIGNFFKPLWPVPELVLQALAGSITFLLVTFVFAAIYKLLPTIRLRWSDVVIGAAVTAFLFTMGRILIEFYLKKFGLGSAYGAAGSLVVIVLWVYYSSQLLFLGAEFTKVYARTVGSQGTHRDAPKAA